MSSLRVRACTAAFLVVAAMGQAAAQNPAGPDDVSVTARRESVIDGLLDALDRKYVFPDKAREMRMLVTLQRSRGAYRSISGDAEFAAALTSDLQSVSHDKHLVVRYTRGASPRPLAPSYGGAASCTAPNGICGTLMAGSVGYLEITSFGVPAAPLSADLARAMTMLADCDALLIDIRRNGGGSPELVRLVSSYLFGPEPVHLNSLYWRPSDRTDHFYTLRSVDGPRFGPQKPVYVLTSKRTFSAAEEFAYNLQALKRAVIVGETTGGGAHPGGMERLGNDFMVFVPSGRAINPITRTNWEGTGVRPDIATPADAALQAALEDVRRKR